MQKKSERLLSQQDDKEEQVAGARIFFKLLEKVGVFGRYQVMTIVLWSLVMYLNGGLMFMTPFLFFEDPYVCPDEPSASECKKLICAMEKSQRPPPPPESIHSLANHFGDYRCPGEELGFDTVIAFMFFGAAMGFLCLTLFGELVGRKLLMQINLGMHVLGMALTVFCANVYMAAAGLFLAAFGISNAYIICFYFILEVVADEWREKMSVMCQTFYGVGVMLDILWYWWIRDWQIILGACYLLPALAAFLIMTLLVEDTPSCLVLRNSSEKALRAFLAMARMNQVQCQLTEQEIIDAREHYEFSIEKARVTKFTVVQLFKYKSTRWITLLLMAMFCVICFAFYAPSLMLDQFELDIFLNGLAIGLSQVAAYIGSFFIVQKIPRKLLAYGCFGVTLVCAVILIFVWNQGGDIGGAGQQAAILVLVFLFSFSISLEFVIFYVYQNELYPTQARVIGTSIISLVGEGVVVFATEILDLCIDAGFRVMILFAALIGICLLINFFMPETFKKVPEELILQFREKSSQYKSKLSSKKDILTSGFSKNVLNQ